MSNKDTTAQTENPNESRIELDEPIQRGNTTITELQIRKPKAGELRGISLLSLGQMDVLALRKVLPRITTPTLTEAEIDNMSMTDFMLCGAAVGRFFMTKKEIAQADSLDE